MRAGISWNSVERISLYTILIVFVIYQGLSMVFPSLLSFLPQQTPLLFLGFSLLLSINYIIRLIEQKSIKSVITIYSTFTEALSKWLEPCEYIREMEIAAFTSYSYLEHIRLQPRIIGHLKILLLYEKKESEGLSSDSMDMSRTTNKIISEWEYLIKIKKIKKIEIRQIKSDASFYFSLIDKHRMLGGVLWPRIGMSGLEPKKAFVITNDSPISYEIMSQSTDWFNSMWKIANVIKGK